MKEIKKKLKVWNKEVFGRLETNKASALQQVDFWDRVESERNLTVEEAELKKKLKIPLRNRCCWRKPIGDSTQGRFG